MKRILLATFILLFDLSAFCRSFIPDSTFNNCLRLSSDYFFASTALTNNFAKTYLNNGFIDNQDKDRVSNKLGNINRFGAEFNTELYFSEKSDSLFGLKNSFFSFSVSNHYHIDSKFKSDVFEIYFRGNKNYAGKTAVLGNFVYNQVLFQQVNFSIGHIFKRNENTYGWLGGVNLNKGQKLFRLTAPEGKLFTQQYGEWLDLTADLTIRRSDSVSHDLGTWSGAGVSANGAFFLTNKNSQTFMLTANNFGYITWNDKSSIVSTDTSFRFNGIDVSELFNFNDTIKNTISLDSSLVQPYLNKKEKKSFSTMLPATLCLSYQAPVVAGKIILDLSVEYLFFTTAAVAEKIGVQYKFNKDHTLKIVLRHGGYSEIQAGLQYEGRFTKHLLIHAGSDYLTGILDKNNGTAQGAFISVSTFF